MNRATILLVVGFFVLTAPSMSAAEADHASRIDEVFASFTEPGSPGAAVAVIHDGKVVFKSGYGLANLELQVPITPHSVFYLGSVSKQFVAASVALLEQDNKPIEVEDKHKLKDFEEKLLGRPEFKGFTAAQVEYVDMMRKVNEAIHKQLAEVEEDQRIES